uniref:Ubiquitin-like protease family profile domain-containing protein n=1 Tax=Amphimedon queenslandica TaxID=400682 RepID=A0A1X7U0H8_AMPQE
MASERVPTGNKDKELVEKTQTLIKRVYSTASSDLRQKSTHKLIPPAAEPTTSHEEAIPPKKKKVEDLDDLAKWTEPFLTTGEMDEVWVSGLPGNIVLTQHERKTLVEGNELTDKHINAYQGLLKAKFPHIKGLYSTLAPSSVQGGWIDSYIQILHCNGYHWIMASTISCDVGEVYIYDSLYRNITDETKHTLNKIFTVTTKYHLPAVPTQKGVTDCGVFAIAFASYLAHGKHPNLLASQYHLDQDSLRPTLLSIFETKLISDFTFIKAN